MKKIFSVCALAFLFYNYAAAANKGYLITKDEKVITGQVLSVNYVGGFSEVLFENDFGDQYHIHPFLIKGFVFIEKNEKIEYQSKYNGSNWIFLRVEIGGRGIRMYKTGSAALVLQADNSYGYSEARTSTEIWLEKEGEKPFKLFLIGFRGQMRKVTADYPELAQKIGQKGYRYKNLKKILQEYNQWFEETRLMM